MIACTLSVAIGGYWFAIAGTKEFQRFSTIFNEEARAKKNRTTKFYTLFTEFLYAHGIFKQLSIVSKMLTSIDTDSAKGANYFLTT